MTCHTNPTMQIQPDSSIALVGHPNVGKSVLFQRLTGQRVVISNYPGTTVEIARGISKALQDAPIIDTPGVIAFPPHSEDEEVTARVLFDEPLKAVLQVGDAKNLRRTLLFSVQLAEMGLPFVLALNMMDEARARGVTIQFQELSKILNTPVVPITAIHDEGIQELIEQLQKTQVVSLNLNYGPEIETALSGLISILPPAPISPRSLGLLWLIEDSVSESWIKSRLTRSETDRLIAIRDQLRASLPGWAPEVDSISDAIQKIRLELVEQITLKALLNPGRVSAGISARLGRLTTHPVWGLAILAIILYALYWFVGVFGAGTLVNFLEVEPAREDRQSLGDRAGSPVDTDQTAGRSAGWRVWFMDNGDDVCPGIDPANCNDFLPGVWGYGRLGLSAAPGRTEQSHVPGLGAEWQGGPSNGIRAWLRHDGDLDHPGDGNEARTLPGDFVIGSGGALLRPAWRGDGDAGRHIAHSRLDLGRDSLAGSAGGRLAGSPPGSWRPDAPAG